MKNNKLHILTFFLVSIMSYSQNIYSNQGLPLPANAEIKENTLQNKFKDLDKSKIPHGLLLDAAVEFIDLKKYNGTIPDSSYTSPKILQNIYNTLVMSRLSNATIFEKTPMDFVADWKNEEKLHLIPLAGMYYQYAQFSEEVQNYAKNNGSLYKLDFNGTSLKDKYINGVWQNPYEEQSVFAIAPACLSSHNLHFNILFPKDLFLSNQMDEVHKIEYRLADNRPYKVLPYDDYIPVDYDELGTYRWTFKLTLKSGEVLYTHTQFTVDGDLDKYVDITRSSYHRSGDDFSEYEKVKIKEYTYSPNSPWYPTLSATLATLYIKKAPGHQKIQKPFIVAEGFDLGHIIHPSEEAGENTIKGFLNTLVYDNNYTLKNYLTNNYDIIYVDWAKGTDFIQNNAKALKAAIHWVNNNKVGNEKNVVLGQSMGGLVARYALKDMEDNGEDHDTKLYISHDSPHLGANIPLGMQYMMNNLTRAYIKAPYTSIVGNYIVPAVSKDYWGSVGEILTITSTPAARQMLINYVDIGDNINNSIHNAWQNELNAKGFPQQTRNVAISNGSECGTDQNLQNLLNVNMEVNKQYLFSDLLGVMLGFDFDDVGTVLLGILPGTSWCDFNFTVKPMTHLNSNKKLYDGSIVYKKEILWFLPAQSTLVEGSAYQPSGILPYDKYGGGKHDLAESQLPEDFQDEVEVNQFGFIPTPSALCIHGGTQTLTEDDYQRSYSPEDDAALSPFDNFVVEKVNVDNQHHISFSDRNGRFIMNQLSNNSNLQNKTITSTNLCGDKIKIGGESIICDDSGEMLYTTGFAPYIQWSFLEGANLVDINSPNNASQFSFTPKNGANGLIRLKVKLWDQDASNTTFKKVWVGKPKVRKKNEGNLQLYIESKVDDATLQEQGIDAIESIAWKRLDTGQIMYGPAIAPLNNIPMEVTITNKCGEKKFTFTFFNTPPPSDCGNVGVVGNSLIPNQYQIEIINPCLFGNGNNLFARNAQQPTYQITVANAMGVIVISTTGTTFSLEGLPTGNYFVQVMKDNEIVASQTLVKQ
ncbi:MAG: hypothetical protein CSA38_00865 [Flavobacteriales bacterium]|nr:MAG: hypothetical protein CSA38_00865 [Flavobacteriales bacterium]